VYRSARRWLEAIHPTVGCHYFSPGLQLPSQPKSVTAYRPVPNYAAWWGWQRHMHVSSFPKAVTCSTQAAQASPRTRTAAIANASMPDRVWATVIVWRIRGKVIRTVLFRILYRIYAQWCTHTCEQFSPCRRMWINSNNLSPVGTVSTWAILHRFQKFYTLRVEIFWAFFIHSSLPMTAMNHAKFHWNRSARFSEIWNTDTQKDATAWTDRRVN